MTSQIRLALLSTVLGCALLTSCSDDPMAPGNSVGTPSYHAELESFDGNLVTVCGAGTNDVYVVGDVIYRHDGSKWSTVTLPPEANRRLEIALGFANGDLVVADSRHVFVRKNDSWVTSSQFPESDSLPSYFRDLTGSAADDLYANTYDGLFHFDGTSWTLTPVQNTGEIADMCSDETGDVWLCGVRGRVDHFDGGTWTSVYLDSSLSYGSIASTPSGRVFVLAQQYSEPWQQSIYEVVGPSSTDWVAENPLGGGGDMLRTDGETLFIAGYGQSSYQIMAFDQGAWSQVARTSFRLESLWAGRGELWGTVWPRRLWSGGAGSGKSAPSVPTRGPITSMVAIDGAIYTGGELSFRYENETWTSLNKEYVSRNPAWAIDGRVRTNIYAAGPDMIMHYNGREWSWVNAGLDTWLFGIWVEANGDVVAVGDGPTILEFDGTEWTKTHVPVSYAFNDVIGVGEIIVAVGTNGRVATRRDGEWYIEPTPTNANLVALWAKDERHIYAASRANNEILFFDGDKWEVMDIAGPRVEDAVDIWGTSPRNLFLLSWDGTLAHFDGHSWTAEEKILSSEMETLCGNGREVVTAGRLGAVSYRR